MVLNRLRVLIQLTLDVERFRLLALPDDVVDLALDDLVVDRPRDRPDPVFSTMIARNYLVVHKPSENKILYSILCPESFLSRQK